MRLSQMKKDVEKKELQKEEKTAEGKQNLDGQMKQSVGIKKSCLKSRIVLYFPEAFGNILNNSQNLH